MKIFVTILANELMLSTDVVCYWKNKIINKKELVLITSKVRISQVTCEAYLNFQHQVMCIKSYSVEPYLLERF